MSDEQATQDKGVETKEVAPAIDTSSLDFMEQIADKNSDAEKQGEIDLAKEEGREPAGWALEEEVKEKEEEEEEVEVGEAEEETEVEEKEEVEDPEIELVVDGEKQKVLLSKIVDAGKRTLQKESAADKRLEEASKLLKDTKKTVEKKAEDKVSDEDIKELRLDYIHKVQYGEPQEAVEALENWEKAVFKKSAGTASGKSISEKTDLKTAIKFVNLEEKLFAPPESGGYKDLFDSDILKKHTATLVDTLVDRGEGAYDSFDTYKKAGDAIRKIAATFDPDYVLPDSVKKDNVDSFEEKKKKKENINNLTAATQKAIEDDKEDDDKVVSIQDTIAEMKEARGQ